MSQPLWTADDGVIAHRRAQSQPPPMPELQGVKTEHFAAHQAAVSQLLRQHPASESGRKPLFGLVFADGLY